MQRNESKNTVFETHGKKERMGKNIENRVLEVVDI